MESNYILYGQVENVFIENIVCDVDKFPDFFFYQTKKNEELLSNPNWSITSQDITTPNKFITVVDETTDFNKYIQSLTALQNSSLKRQKIVTIPMISVLIYELNDYDSTVPKRIKCAPLNSSILEVPSVGQWVMIVAVELTGTRDISSGYVPNYFYFPFSLTKKSFNKLSNIKTIDDNKKLSINRVKQILWPRTGSTIIKNSNGKSNIQVNENCLLLSSGYNDIKSFDGALKTQQMKLYEFTKFNPPTEKTDAFLYIENFNRKLENELFEYKKLLYESGKFEDITLIDEEIDTLTSSINFKQRLKSHFNIDHSNQYEWKFETKQNLQDVEINNDNGIVIASNNLHLVKNTTDQQTNYSVARSEPTMDLIFGLVDIVEKLIGALEAHTHLGSPAAVMNPDPGFTAKLPELKQSIKTIKDGLKDIQSPSIHIS